MIKDYKVKAISLPDALVVPAARAVCLDCVVHEAGATKLASWSSLSLRSSSEEGSARIASDGSVVLSNSH